ncbi:MAG: hypothetical protein ACYC3X_31385 [Pirellulaceae bacterium]
MNSGKRTRTLDDATSASNPGQISLSHTKLRALRPDLYGIGGIGKSILAFFRVGWPHRIYIEEQLQYGDSRAAVVVSTSPLLIAAYTDELDCIALLRFPDEFVHQYRLSNGTRLLTVNCYGRSPAYAPDLILGPELIQRWTGFHPLIADFLCDDHTRVDARKMEIAEDEWQRAHRMGTEYMRLRPGVARDGRPVYSSIPASVRNEDRMAHFVPGISIAAPSHTAAQRGPDGPFDIEVLSRYSTHSQAAIAGLRNTVWKHLSTAGADVFREASLRLFICCSDPESPWYRFPLLAGAAKVSIAVSGTVNGAKIDEKVNTARFTGAFGGSSEGMLDACLLDCTGKVLLVLDRVAGRKASTFSQVWSTIQFTKWLAFAVTLIGYAILYAVVQLPRSKVQSTGFNLFILASASFMASVGIFGIIAMAALVCAPTEFLKSDPRGINAMSRAGIRNVIALRGAALIIGLMASAMDLFAVWVLFDRS